MKGENRGAEIHKLKHLISMILNNKLEDEAKAFLTPKENFDISSIFFNYDEMNNISLDRIRELNEKLMNFVDKRIK